MTPQTFIFIGRSGCGKGTQAKLLDEKIREKHGDTPIYHLETGEKFRAFIAEEGYTNTIARQIMKEGKRQPDFLAIWMWSHLLIENLKGEEFLILDGTPRSYDEAVVLLTALNFYGHINPQIIHLNVSRDWSQKHLAARGRADDDKDGIERRLDWYEKDVIPAVEYFRKSPDISFIEIDGEQSIEAVHAELLKRVNLG